MRALSIEKYGIYWIFSYFTQ